MRVINSFDLNNVNNVRRANELKVKQLEVNHLTTYDAPVFDIVIISLNEKFNSIVNLLRIKSSWKNERLNFRRLNENMQSHTKHENANKKLIESYT